MTDGLTYFACGPSSATCKCDCSGSGKCEHVWDGPVTTLAEIGAAPDGETATCSRCGEWAINHDMWL